MDGLGTTTDPDAAPRFERAPMHQGASTDQLLRAADGLDAIAATCAGARAQELRGMAHDLRLRARSRRRAELRRPDVLDLAGLS